MLVPVPLSLLSSCHHPCPTLPALCRCDMTGCIVDNKLRSRVWSLLLLGSDTSPSSLQALGPVSRKEEGAPQELSQEDARVLDADVKRTR